ncbi:putative short-chain dehydrogenase [Xylariales sp. PMI_506]|nr:putative short-chain dehydrogenase [Xylariales sp. PMI_506]
MEDIATNFTTTVHRSVYPAIAPTRPELSQAGKTVLITGGATGIGRATALSFVQASAATVIIAARRKELLEAAASELEQKARELGVPTKIVPHTLDVTDDAKVEEFWDGLKSQGILVDIFVNNAAKFTEPKPLFELGYEEVWNQFEVNVKGPLHMCERFYKQREEGRKLYLVNFTTGSIHTLQNEIVKARPAYTTTKASMFYALQCTADAISPDEMQIITVHPGMVYGDGWAAFGVTRDMMPFDDDDLPGAFAVWTASDEAKFLHGRLAWCTWDVTELANGETAKKSEENPDYLRLGVIGLRGAKRA